MAVNSQVKVRDMRKPYRSHEDIFDICDLSAHEPMAQFTVWFNEAVSQVGEMEANAMSVATATREGKPSVRMLLMKGFDQDGFIFYTNYNSKKAQDLDSNPFVCLNFYWELLKRQVRVEGTVSRLSGEESTDYFHSRPRASQIGACVSNQSSVIASREVLNKKNEELTKQFADESKQIPKPDYWGGYRVTPTVMEFWQGQSNRLHDRIVFRQYVEGEDIDPSVTLRGDAGWVIERLSP